MYEEQYTHSFSSYHNRSPVTIRKESNTPNEVNQNTQIRSFSPIEDLQHENKRLLEEAEYWNQKVMQKNNIERDFQDLLQLVENQTREIHQWQKRNIQLQNENQSLKENFAESRISEHHISKSKTDDYYYKDTPLQHYNAVPQSQRNTKYVLNYPQQQHQQHHHPEGPYEQINMLSEQLSLMKQQYLNRSEQIEFLKSDNMKLQDLQNNWKQKEKLLREEVAMLEETLHKREKEYISLSQYQQLDNQCQKIQQEKENLQTKLNSLQSQLKIYEEEEKFHKQKLERLENDHLQEIQQINNQYHDQLQRIEESYKKQLDSSLKSITDLEKQNQDLKQQHKQQFEEQHMNFQKILQTKTTRIEELQVEVQRIHIQNDDVFDNLKQDNAQMKIEIESLREQVSLLEELKNIQQKQLFEQAQNHFQQKIEKLVKDNEFLTYSLETKEAECDNWKNKYFNKK